jgi:aminoglycoside phosphotransferase (APT) family kinase protein
LCPYPEPYIIVLVRSEIALSSGVSVTIEGRQPPQGSKHEVLFGILRDTGEAVVVKLEGIPGALGRESAALEYLAARRGPVPEVKAIGLTDVAGERVPCLVLKRQEGAAPTSRDGWRRMGRALGRLAEPASDIEQLPVVDRERFGDEHAQRVRELGDCLTAIVAAVPDWPSLASAEIPLPGPLVLTHGDPGPGNFLDDGRSGWLIDWEDAQIAPRGLDLARVAFIAWLGSGPAGFVGRDHHARARAAVAGYLQTVPGGWQPSVEETRWWFAVAGVQFIHHRWQLGGWPAPWEEAAEVLQRGLIDTIAWA